MLVLSRKVGEEIVIGDNIRVKVVAVQGNKVRLGFEAPNEVVIRREEICFEAPARKVFLNHHANELWS